MSKLQTLSAQARARVAAAAEEISALFDRTRAEYEEELSTCRLENQRKQQLLEQALSSRVLLLKDPVLDFTLTPRIKEEPEEPSVTLDEDQLQGPVPEVTAVCVKSEESSDSQTDSDNDDNWEPPFSCSTAPMETEAAGDRDNQTRQRSTELSAQNKSGPETSVHNEDVPGAAAAERKKHQCSVCNKRFTTKKYTQLHLRVHTGETPHHCTTCEKSFAQKSQLVSHMRTHTGEKPYSCSNCEKSFARKFTLDGHMKTHTGEKPHHCTTCKKSFAHKSHLVSHMRTHTGEKPYSCAICKQTFTYRYQLIKHTRSH